MHHTRIAGECVHADDEHDLGVTIYDHCCVCGAPAGEGDVVDQDEFRYCLYYQEDHWDGTQYELVPTPASAAAPAPSVAPPAKPQRSWRCLLSAMASS